jgi:nucleotide-binding universal stress UspA family protein
VPILDDMGARMTDSQRILVGVDGSDDSQHAVEWCAEFARRSGAEVIVCHVVSNVGDWMLSAAQVDFQNIEKEHQRLLSGAWTEPLRGGGVRYEVVQLSGDPVKELLALADSKDVDLIIIGKAGHGALRELLLGGTATKLAHRTTRPLLLIPARHAEHRPNDAAQERPVPLPG